MLRPVPLDLRSVSSDDRGTICTERATVSQVFRTSTLIDRNPGEGLVVPVGMSMTPK